ncbi:MAG: EAL domain-containing protein [Lachnospiraceae bacterium]|nr:EAL domain-containing protein [Lachnospiraceae bacterium]
MEDLIYNGKRYAQQSEEVQKALEEINIYTFNYYHEDNLVVFSDACAKHFGINQFCSNANESVFRTLVCEDDLVGVRELHNKILSGVNKGSIVISTKHGSKTLRVTMTVIERNKEGEATVMTGILEDAEEDMRIAEMVMGLSLNYECVYYVDFVKNQIVPYRMSDVINKEYGSYFNARPPYEKAIAAYISRTVAAADREEMTEVTRFENIQEKLLDTKTFVHDYTVSRNDKTLYFRMKVFKVNSGETLTKCIMGFGDVSKEKQRDLERYAYVDPVTGGDNYNFFKIKLADVQIPGFFVLMDIHSFKVVNTVCGISRGDEALSGIWQCIKKALRKNDLAAHINADHFVMFLQGPTDEEVIWQLKGLTEELAWLAIKKKLPRLVPYFGITRWNSNRKVELAYGESAIAKHEIKNRKDINYYFFTQENNTRLMEEKKMEDSFPAALRAHQFEVWYQPKYDTMSGQMVGAEALCRWRKIDGSLVSPGAFIPLFEQNGLIRQLDEYIFRTTCQQQKAWLDAGKNVRPVSVNLSRASIYFQNVVEEYSEIVKEIGIDPSLVPIEITESVAIDNDDIKSLAENFYKSGFPLHVDDFGTGYSSLVTLNIFHFDTLKLDKSLIDYIGNYGGERLLTHTVALAKELGLNVVAEGVEKDYQVEFLKNLKCDSIQGFYFSRPLSQADYEKML